MENKLKTLYSELNERLSFLQGLELSDSVMAQRAEVALCIVRVQQLLLGDVDSSQPAARGLSRDASVDGKYLPIDGQTGLELSWEETARNFMEESGRLKAENEKLRELIELHDRIKVLNGYLRKDDDNVYTEDLIFIASKRISELRSELGLDK